MTVVALSIVRIKRTLVPVNTDDVDEEVVFTNVVPVSAVTVAVCDPVLT